MARIVSVSPSRVYSAVVARKKSYSFKVAALALSVRLTSVTVLAGPAAIQPAKASGSIGLGGGGSSTVTDGFFDASCASAWTQIIVDAADNTRMTSERCNELPTPLPASA